MFTGLRVPPLDITRFAVVITPHSHKLDNRSLQEVTETTVTLDVQLSVCNVNVISR